MEPQDLQGKDKGKFDGPQKIMQHKNRHAESQKEDVTQLGLK
jgi:hypothetical protein